MSDTDSSSSRLHRPANTRRRALGVGLITLALVTMGSTCIVVEEGAPLYGEDGIEEPGIVVPQNNAERMEDQEADIIADEDR